LQRRPEETVSASVAAGVDAFPVHEIVEHVLCPVAPAAMHLVVKDSERNLQHHCQFFFEPVSATAFQSTERCQGQIARHQIHFRQLADCASNRLMPNRLADYLTS